MPGNVIHLKLEYCEAIENRKEVLSSEINILQLIQKIKRYHEIRKKELEKKVEIQKKLKTINVNLGKLTKLLPIFKKPKILRKSEETEIKENQNESVSIKNAPLRKNHPLEDELQLIRNQLNALESKA